MAQAFVRSTLCALALFGFAGAAKAQEVNLYTVREPGLVRPLIEAFTKKTGIKVNTIFMNDGLAERVQAEGARSPADVLMTVDVARLVEIAEKGIAQPIRSETLESAIPAQLRDAEGRWFALSMRARLVYVAKDRVKDEAITYEDLADPKWKGKLCMRPGNHPYNIALFAAMIAHKGEDATREWLKGVKANLAFKPNGNDRAQAKSVFAGECDLALANTYYMGKMLTNTEEPEQKKWAGAVKIVFPSSPQFGTHVNISGMMLTANAPNKDNALKLMEFLAGDEAQMLYAQGNYEYPVNPAVAATDLRPGRL